jgi:hypothetical protein
MSKIEEQVIQKIRSRAEVGEKKYGVTMERNDLNIMEWLQHLQEELMDAVVYVEKVMEGLDRTVVCAKIHCTCNTNAAAKVCKKDCDDNS